MSERNTEASDKNYEKITVNLPLVDIGKIDYLTDQGHYNSRAEFIRVAVKNEISSHKYEFDKIQQSFDKEEPKGKNVRSFVGLGSLNISRTYLEKLLNEGKTTSIFVIGHLRIGRNVDVELVEKTVRSFRVYGIKRGPPGVISFLESLKYVNGD
ncbi:MAG: hypothetical protein GOP50_03755 [Candidatus Heimdallarchaeota archaeon]|nr:hypothetical protein [Candidatus Heimdallarchaeota archaeon]